MSHDHAGGRAAASAHGWLYHGGAKSSWNEWDVLGDGQRLWCRAVNSRTRRNARHSEACASWNALVRVTNSLTFERAPQTCTRRRA